MRPLLSTISDFMLLDLLGDRRIRPILAYALFILALGTLIFHWLEGWTWVDAFYFSSITLFTIGYGDLVPTTDLTKIITVLYALNGVGVLVALATQALQVRQEKFRDRAQRHRGD